MAAQYQQVMEREATARLLASKRALAPAPSPVVGVLALQVLHRLLLPVLATYIASSSQLAR